jgi:hypothetical protein
VSRATTGAGTVTHTYSYSFGPADASCTGVAGSVPTAGSNGNRTKTTDTVAGAPWPPPGPGRTSTPPPRCRLDRTGVRMVAAKSFGSFAACLLTTAKVRRPTTGAGTVSHGHWLRLRSRRGIRRRGAWGPGPP